MTNASEDVLCNGMPFLSSGAKLFVKVFCVGNLHAVWTNVEKTWFRAVEQPLPTDGLTQLFSRTRSSCLWRSMEKGMQVFACASGRCLHRNYACTVACSENGLTSDVHQSDKTRGMQRKPYFQDIPRNLPENSSTIQHNMLSNCAC